MNYRWLRNASCRGRAADELTKHAIFFMLSSPTFPRHKPSPLWEARCHYCEDRFVYAR